ncbi:Exodeoxyribonuclease 7 small subunit [Novipirellula galeiformis]|uniref:Exodeoxyribonuclease 7 small subunit n=1 Tax=Novipirellula galeiformis TaxID=2528004 RepID=A0A5C6C9Z6_9BACT|nr:exodeoxyribonuclease VII small subunit [Novipirellula galeiformis]TWU21018.1 Exodeoxyribonuclease 7 small subunit [Novipirellula galeiformis]
MAKKKSSTTDSDGNAESPEIDFEAAVGEVQKIVDNLESGDLGLSESLKQYELGIQRLNQCQGLLEAAERKVTLLSGFDADGNPVTEPFAGGEKVDAAPSKAGRRNAGASNRAAAKKTDTSGELF